jgi:hypothetical protein
VIAYESATSRKYVRLDVVLDHSGAEDCYTPGGLFTIRGCGFGTYRNVPRGVGIYLSSHTGGLLVPVHGYILWRDDEITGIWPVRVQGPQWLILGTQAGNGFAMSDPHRLEPSC